MITRILVFQSPIFGADAQRLIPGRFSIGLQCFNPLFSGLTLKAYWYILLRCDGPVSIPYFRG